MRPLLPVLLMSLTLAGCAAGMRTTTASCPTGQTRVRTAQLFLGRSADGQARISNADLGRFVDQEITPKFPDGLTVLDGGAQWQGAENRLIREATKVVLIVLPTKGDAVRRVDAVRTAYKTRFNQDSALLVTQASCVSF